MLSVIEKIVLRRGLLGDMEKKQMELIFFSHILGHNENVGVWQGVALMGSSWVLSVLFMVISSVPVPHSSD